MNEQRDPGMFPPDWGRRLAEIVGVGMLISLAVMQMNTAVGQSEPLPGFGRNLPTAQRGTAPNQLVSRVMARELMGLARLPPGSIERAGPPDSALGQAFSRSDSNDVTDVTHFWQVPMPLATFLDFAQRKPPRPLDLFQSGTASTARGGTEDTLGWSLPTPPPAIYQDGRECSRLQAGGESPLADDKSLQRHLDANTERARCKCHQPER